MKAAPYNFLGLICLGALTLLPTHSHSYAQDTSNNTKEQHYWVNLGGGFGWVHGGLGGDPAGVSGGLSLSYSKGSSLFSIRGVVNEEFKLDLWGYSGPPESVWDVGVLYGRIAKASSGLASISAGVSIVGASLDEGTLPLRLGIPIEGQLFWTPTSVVGIGIYGFANWNSEKSFLGALLSLQIGKLR
ncbi:MAG: hypothetical protein A2142_08440 [candidate division Zixibacteria bacterium RBG_16_48_11]|nr:MAG: hypothetical protein A2142_08440 [candidate division Zixibacteria bacterium RBG_16_48_11]